MTLLITTRGAHAHAPSTVASQILEWTRRCEEIDADRNCKCTEAVAYRINLRRFAEVEFKKKQRGMSDAERSFYERVTRDLDQQFPVKPPLSAKKRGGDVLEPDQDEGVEKDALNDVDVLVDGPLGTHDIVPDRVAFFSKKQDEDESLDGIDDDDDEPENVVCATLSHKGFRLPTDMLSTLQTHQAEALLLLIDRISDNVGAVLAHAPGLGKTLTTLCLLSSYKFFCNTGRSIVVCPKSLILQWETEVKKFDFLNLTTFTVDESVKIHHVHAAWKKSKGGVMLIGTDAFKQQFPNEKQLEKERKHAATAGSSKRSQSKVAKLPAMPLCELQIDDDTILVVDEAHEQLQTGHSHFFNIIEKQLKTSRVVLLTGTPIQHSLRKYFNMVQLVAADLFPPSYTHLQFEKEYAKPISDGAQKKATLEDQGEAHLALGLFKRRVNDAVSYLPADDIFGETLPPKVEMLMMHPFDQALPEDGNYLEKREAVHAASRVTKYRLLQTILANVTSIDPTCRLLVFSSRLDTLKYMYSSFMKSGINCWLLTGEIDNMYMRAAIIESFRETSGSVLFISMDLGACGLNLSCANRVVLLDVSWNPMAEVQAVARAYRMGQEKPVHVYRFCAMDTPEHDAYNLGVKKFRLASSIADDNDVARVYREEDFSKHAGDEKKDDDHRISEVLETTEMQLVDALKKSMKAQHKATIFVNLHDDNVRVNAGKQNIVDNELRNYDNRTKSLSDERRLPGVEDPVPSESVVDPDGHYVPPMALVWLLGGHVNRVCVNFERASVDDDDDDEDAYYKHHMSGEIDALIRPSWDAYDAYAQETGTSIELQLWRLKMKEDALDPDAYDATEWKYMDTITADELRADAKNILRLTEIGEQRTKEHQIGQKRIKMNQVGIWSYKTRIVDSHGAEGPWSDPSAALFIFPAQED